MNLDQWNEAKGDAILRGEEWFERGDIAIDNKSMWEAERCNNYGFAWQAIAERIDALVARLELEESNIQ